MKKKVIISILVTLFVLLFVTELSFSQSNIQRQGNMNIPTPIYLQLQVDTDVLKVSKITNWNQEISQYFVSEARARGVDIFEEALPIVCVETGGTYDFNLVNHNNNNTSDHGVFQINDVTYNHIIKQFKTEGRQFDSWDKLSPQLNISAGMYWISKLKSKYNLNGHQLFSCYNKGVAGAKKYAKRNGTYVSRYSREVESAKIKIVSDKIEK